MDKTILVTRPDHDITTRYLFYWAKEVLFLAEKKCFRVFDLKKDKASQKEFESRVKKHNPGLIFVNGHGREDRICGYNNKFLVKVGKNEKTLSDKTVYALSCQSASKLGKESVRNGTLSYIGYLKDFIFCYDEHKISRPTEDKIAKLFLEPSNQVVISLIKENTAKESSKKSKDFFFKNIQKVLSSDSSKEFSYCAKYLWWDMKNQVCLEKNNFQK